MKLTVPKLLKARGWTAYELAQRSEGRISTTAAYRLANGQWKCLSGTVIAALCMVFDVEPGELFEPAKKRPHKPR